MTALSAAVVLAAALVLAGCGVPGGSAAMPTTPDDSDAAAWTTAETPTETVTGKSGETFVATSTGQAPDDSPLSDQLAGRTFLSTGSTGHELVPGSTVRVEFRHDGTVGVGAGCNWMDGVATWDGDVLSVANMATTEIGCEKPRADQDSWLMGLLGSGLAVALNGNRLTLTAGGVTIELLDRTKVDPDRPFVGTTWTLDGIVSGTGDSGAVSSVPAELTVTLRVVADRLDVFNGRAWMSARIPAGQGLSTSAGTVRIADGLGADAIGCDGGGTSCFVDVGVLGSDFDYEITADSLRITGVGATEGRGLVFRAVPDGFTSPDLIGHTYRLTRLFTDAGGVDTRYDDARFTITFAAAGATAESQCGTISYPVVRYYAAGGSPIMVDLGEPTGPACSLGSDPSGVPRGRLMTGFSAGELYVSTGFVGWYFERAE